MMLATEIRPGSVICLEKQFYKVVESVTHTGGGKTGAMVHVKLRNLATGNIAERRLATGDKVDDVPLERTKMQFLYAEGDGYHFMNLQTYDQIRIPKNTIGPASAFLKDGDELDVESYEEKPLSILYPPTVELKVANTGAGLRGQSDSTFKEAALENGLKILVPQFIKEGDHIRVDVETHKYLDRVMDREEKGQKFVVSAPSQPGVASQQGQRERKTTSAPPPKTGDKGPAK